MNQEKFGPKTEIGETPIYVITFLNEIEVLKSDLILYERDSVTRRSQKDD